MPPRTTKRGPPETKALAGEILQWYDRNRRRLPWRAPPGDSADPYRVWLSEIMLQQTTVAAVGPYFETFLAKWPRVEDLAAANLEDVLHAWQGLGYYARARNLHKCAGMVARDRDGAFPDTEEALLSLPGVGRYTAAAIAAIAFDRPATVMDGNVERVMARLFCVREPLPDARKVLFDHALALTPSRRPGDYAQAAMDLGATVCTPRKPKCILCPWNARCRGRRDGIAERLPMKAPKKKRPTRRGVAFWIVRADGAILLRRRPERGLLGGMVEVPSSAWEEGPVDVEAAKAQSPVPIESWRRLPGAVRHSFTHFHLEMTILAGQAPKFTPAPGARWVQPDELGDQALPSVMKKLVGHAFRKG